MNAQLETGVRLGSFAVVLLLMSVWEWIAPRRTLTVVKSARWSSHLALVFINAVVSRVAIPVSAVVAAEFAQARHWGVCTLVTWPDWLEIAVAVVVFDLAIYIQHVLFHSVPLLWRLHIVHHADLDLDVTTGLRFHTLEILLSAIIKLAVVLVLGPSAIAVVIFEVLLNASSMFNHSNIKLPVRIDKLLRWIVVTPDMHCVHHSAIRAEANSNYGFNLPWWDYLLGTYREQPANGLDQMRLGVSHLRDEKLTGRLPGMLRMPFTTAASTDSPEEPINNNFPI